MAPLGSYLLAMVLLEFFFSDWNFQFSFFFQKEAILFFCVLAQHGIMHMMQVWGSTITAARSRSYSASHPWKATGHVHHPDSSFGSHKNVTSKEFQHNVAKYDMSVSSSFYWEGLQKEQLASVAFQSSSKHFATSIDFCKGHDIRKHF